jgi:hypothetical protein
MVERAEQYEYSGHHAYLRGKGTEIIDPARVLGMLGGARRYERFVNDGLKAGHQEEYYAVADQRFLGDQEFAEGQLVDRLLKNSIEREFIL